jgi:hypothetical protein
MKKRVLLTILILWSALELQSKRRMFNPIRNSDVWGSGSFGASRGNRPHLGIDITTIEGEPIYAPFPMEVTRVSYPYSDTTGLTGVAFRTEIGGVDYDGRWWYFVPDSAIIGNSVNKGQFLGVAQSLQSRYPNITDHTHLQLRTTTELPGAIELNGWYYVNPSQFI